jgi:hypothetical protein
VAGICPAPLWRNRRGQGAHYKMRIPCREAPHCSERQQTRRPMPKGRLGREKQVSPPHGPSLPASCKKAYRNRAGVFGGPAGKLPHIAAGIFPKPCSGTFMSRLHAFPGRTRTSLKVNSSVTPSFLIIRNCKGLKIPPPGVRYCNIWVYPKPDLSMS